MAFVTISKTRKFHLSTFRCHSTVHNILLHASPDTLSKTSTLSFCYLCRMQTQHNEEEESELELPGSDIAHPASLFDVDTPFTISCTQKEMTTTHSSHNTEMSYAQKLKILGFVPVPIFNIYAVYLILLHSYSVEASFPGAHRGEKRTDFPDICA